MQTDTTLLANIMQHCWAQRVASICIGTTTVLALVVYSLKPVKLLSPCKRTQHCWPRTPNNTQQCCDLLRPFAWALSYETPLTFSLAVITQLLSLFVSYNMKRHSYNFKSLERENLYTYQFCCSCKIRTLTLEELRV